MNEHKKTFYRNQAESVIKKLELRKMQGFYCPDIESAKAKVLEGHELIIREDAKTPEEIKEIKARTVNSDFFLMSTNAITLDGELINIDGRGNRVSYMIYGPENVIIIAGMNKVVSDRESGIRRVHDFASPPNTVRLNRNTPCAKTGRCGNCIKDSICAQIVVTRCSMIEGRIKVILVGEELGY